MDSFRIPVVNDELTDLRRRLDGTRYAAPAPGEPWEFGMPPERLRELVDHWRTAFDGAAVVDRLNAIPQFTAQVDGRLIIGLSSTGGRALRPSC